MTRSEANRFYFGAQRADFAGRDEELARLNAFLDSDWRFTWWLVAGAGGTGKSRLALQFCSRHSARWHVGFLGEADFPWDQWRPKVPTLVVIDYAGGRAEDVGRIVRTLRDRKESRHLDRPVRLLLLERTADGPWYDRFIGGDPHLTLDARFDEPLKLTQQLDDAALAAIARDYGAPLPDADAQQAFAAMLREIDPDARPLFAALLGDALAAGRQPHQLDREALIRDVLHREDEKFWRRAGVTEADRNLLALATMTGGVAVSALPIAGTEGWLPSDDDYEPARFEAMTGRDATDVVPPLEPDLIGELFVLDRLDLTRHRRPADHKRAEALRTLAWREAPDAMAWYVVATTFDYPDHPAVAPLRAMASESEDQRRCWSMAMADAISSLCDIGEYAAAREMYAAVQALAKTYPKEPSLRKSQAEGAVALIPYLITSQQLTAAREMYEELKALAAASQPDETALRLAQERIAADFIRAFSLVRDYVSAGEFVNDVSPPAPLTAIEKESLVALQNIYENARQRYDVVRRLVEVLPNEIEWRYQLIFTAFKLMLRAPLKQRRIYSVDEYENVFIKERVFVDEELIREIVENPTHRDSLVWMFDQFLSRSNLHDGERKHLSALREAVNGMFR